MRHFSTLTIHRAQETQPWTVPYSAAIQKAVAGDLPHLLASHAVLHAMKTVGQLAAVFESLDHSGTDASPEQVELLRGRAADLVTVALRLGNLYGFDVAQALVERSEDKNGVTLSWPGDYAKGELR